MLRGRPIGDTQWATARTDEVDRIRFRLDLTASGGGYGFGLTFVLCGAIIRTCFSDVGYGFFVFFGSGSVCGIVGFWNRREENTGLGQTILKMLKALDCRGPDSAGVALYGEGHNGRLVLRVSLGEDGDYEERARQVVARTETLGSVSDWSRTAEYLRLVVGYGGEANQLERAIEAAGEGVEVVSMGRHLEIVKQVGSPDNLDNTYRVSSFEGTHGIGHTRLSTESRIDLSHSQPFWAHGHPDLAIVHNGHITNYHKLRRIYEQEGARFYTENDSEIIGMYLRRQLADGKVLEDAMAASLVDLDGSFSYLVATSDAVGFVRDPYAFKPLLFAETDAFAAVATEEIAFRSALDGDYDVVEARAKDMRLWRN